jgi:hypothetical protein
LNATIAVAGVCADVFAGTVPPPEPPQPLQSIASASIELTANVFI